MNAIPANLLFSTSLWQFYRCFLALLRCNKATMNSSNKSLPRSCHVLQQVQDKAVPTVAALVEQPSGGSLDLAGNVHPPLEDT